MFTKKAEVRKGAVKKVLAQALREDASKRYCKLLYGSSPLTWKVITCYSSQVAEIEPKDDHEICELLTEILLKPNTGLCFRIEDNPKDESVFFVTHH